MGRWAKVPEGVKGARVFYPDAPVPYHVDPWRMSLLLETARKSFGPYAKYFVTQWVKNVTKGGELPKDEKTWSEEGSDDSE